MNRVDNPESSSGKNLLFDQLNRSWDALLSNSGSMEEYVNLLDRFLLSLIASDMVNDMASTHLNNKFLKLIYPDGENSPKRDPSTISIDEIRSRELDPHNLILVIGAEAFLKANLFKEAILGMTDQKKLQ